MGLLHGRFLILMMLLASGFQLSGCLSNERLAIELTIPKQHQRSFNVSLLQDKISKTFNITSSREPSDIEISINTFHSPSFLKPTLLRNFSSGTTGNRSCLSFIFLDGESTKLQYTIDSIHGIRTYALDPATCQIAHVQQVRENSICSLYTALDLELLKLTVKYFYFTKVSIIYGANPCDVAFAKEMSALLPNLQFSLQGRGADGVELRLYPIPAGPPVKSEIMTILYQIKTEMPALIICLCDLRTLNLVTQMAASFSLLGNSHTWMTFHLHSNKELVSKPKQMLLIHQLQFISGASWTPVVIEETLLYFTERIVHLHITRGTSLPSCDQRAPDWLTPYLLGLRPPRCGTSATAVSMLYQLTVGQEWGPILSYSKLNGAVIHSASSEYMRLYEAMLHGAHVSVVTILDAPFTMLADYLYTNNSRVNCEHGILCRIPRTSGPLNLTRWDTSCCIGYAVELLLQLEVDNNIHASLYVVEDGFYGALTDGRWDGMVGDVLTGKADWAIAGLTINNERSTVVDFTEPFMRVDIGIVIPSQKTPLGFVNFEFIHFLSADLLWLIFATFVVGTVLVYGFENEQFVFVRFFNPNAQPPTYAWREGFSYFSGLTFQRDLGGKNPHRSGARVTAVIFAFAMVIIMTTYTAVLTASKVTQQESNPFLGIKDPRMQHPTEAFKFATVAQTSIEAFFRRSPDPVLHNMYRFMRRYNTPNTFTAIERLLSGELQAFINEYPFMLHYISKQTDCRLKIVGDPITQAGYGIALRENSPWKHRLSQSILFYKENGFLDHLNQKWLKNFCEESNKTMASLASLPVEYFGGAYLLLVAALLVSIVLLGAEHVYHRYHRRVVDPIHEALSNWRTTRAGRRNAVQIEGLEKWQKENLPPNDFEPNMECSSAEDMDEFCDVKRHGSPFKQLSLSVPPMA